MNVSFQSKWLLELYETGNSKKLRKYPAGIADSFFEVMQIIESIDTIQDLFAFPSLRFEHLSGKRQHQHSLRLNKQFRLIVQLDNINTPSMFTIIDIEDYHK